MRSHETAVLKADDAHGDPAEPAAVVVWKAEDTAQTAFEADNFVGVPRHLDRDGYGTSPSGATGGRPGHVAEP